MASRTLPRLRHRACRANGRLFTYGEANSCALAEDGDDPTIVLIHGWGLAHSSYRRAAEALAAKGFRVLVPDLPGFGWTGDLRRSDVNFANYAGAVADFIDAVVQAHPAPGGRRKVHIVGHSFGGAVGAQLAHDIPELVESLTLVAAASGATWSRDDLVERLMAERPLWDWALHLLSEFPLKEFPVAAAPVFRDLGHNLIWHLPSVALAAHITRHSDLRSELSAVVAAGIPVNVIRACDDGVVPQACFDDQCLAAGCTGVVVDGNHGWPLTDPDAFARVISDLVGPPVAG
ncbi:MAG TPA: alpha/beta fold hydrolase [Acidimicrobiales bacterium]|nr:alpha/beta fold hydrolase [Acidimicrobiales bacterium]